MFRRFWRKLIPTHAIFPLVMSGVMNMLAFYGPKLAQVFTGTARMHDLTTALDEAIPFSPVWVIPYILTFALWTYQYIMVTHDSEEMANRLIAADTLGKLVSMLFFIFYPTTNVRPEVTGSGLAPFLMRMIYTLDTPTNLLPSLHCFIAWLGTRLLWGCKHLPRRGLRCGLCTVGSVLVFLSTLFTKQHVIYDVFAGVALAELCYAAASWTRLPQLLGRANRRFQKTKLAAIL